MSMYKTFWELVIKFEGKIFEPVNPCISAVVSLNIDVKLYVKVN